MERMALDARLLQAAPFAALALDSSLRVVAWNAEASRLFGEEEALGAEVTARIAGVGEAFWRALIATGAGRGSFDGRVIEWTAAPVAGADGSSVVACYGRDVTAQAGVDAERTLADILLRAITDNLDIVVWAMERDGRCTYHRGKALTSLGLPPGGFVGKNIRDIYGPENTRSFDPVFAGELQYVDGVSHGLNFQNWMIPMRGPSGAVELLVAVSLNVTDQVRGEQALRDRLEQIEAQQRTIRELSTPIVEVWDRVLMLPLLGMVDEGRAAEIMEELLQAITAKRARFAIIDMTGVNQIDAATAGHLIGLVRAIRLLGAEGVVTGIHPNIAQTIIDLGTWLPRLTVHATLREALGQCIGRMVSRT